jgi:hypothetical protein
LKRLDQSDDGRAVPTTMLLSARALRARSCAAAAAAAAAAGASGSGIAGTATGSGSEASRCKLPADGGTWRFSQPRGSVDFQRPGEGLGAAAAGRRAGTAVVTGQSSGTDGASRLRGDDGGDDGGDEARGDDGAAALASPAGANAAPRGEPGGEAPCAAAAASAAGDGALLSTVPPLSTAQSGGTPPGCSAWPHPSGASTLPPPPRRGLPGGDGDCDAPAPLIPS